MHLTDVETALRATFDRSRSTDGRVPGSRIREALDELAGLVIDVAPYEIGDDVLAVEVVPAVDDDPDGLPPGIGVLCNRRLGLTGGPDGDGGWGEVGFELQVPVSVPIEIFDSEAQLHEPKGVAASQVAALLGAFDAAVDGTGFATTPTDPDVFLVDDDELF